VSELPREVAALVALAVGACVGSFLNVVAYRLPRRESLLRPRSRCPACGTPIAAYDNVPLVSFLVLRGRCRHCGVAISRRYPTVEGLSAVVFAAVTAARWPDARLALWLPLSALLIAVAVSDLERRIIPNRLVLAALAYLVIAAPLVARSDLVELAAAGAGAFLALFVVALAYPAGMGMGDVKLAGVLGLYLGVGVIPALFVAFLVGAVVGIALIAREGRGARKRGVPFGPFLALGALVGILAGPELVDLYVDRFLS